MSRLWYYILGEALTATASYNKGVSAPVFRYPPLNGTIPQHHRRILFFYTRTRIALSLHGAYST